VSFILPPFNYNIFSHPIPLFNLAVYSSLHFQIFRWLISHLAALSLPSFYHTLYLLGDDYQDGRCGETADDADEEDNGLVMHGR